jgi:hypothetical protein
MQAQEIRHPTSDLFALRMSLRIEAAGHNVWRWVGRWITHGADNPVAGVSKRQWVLPHAALDFTDGYVIAKGLWYDSEIQKAFACGSKDAGVCFPGQIRALGWPYGVFYSASDPQYGNSTSHLFTDQRL